MASVTQRVKEVTQPRGGYLPIKNFSKEFLQDESVLNTTENIHASLVGLVVDYLTRFMQGASVDDAFHISMMGAVRIGMHKKASLLKSQITGLDDLSIISACKLAGFDVCFRTSVSSYKPVENIMPDEDTIHNIRIMVKRSILFFEKYGPVTCSEPTFEGGYTDTIDCGDGDFVAANTLWDFKVSKTSPTSKHTLQILIYYIMGLHSKHEYFQDIQHLGFFNPRLNIVYRCEISSISPNIISEVENTVIGYSSTQSPVDIPDEQSEQPDLEIKQEYTVSEICSHTGLSKNRIYSEIRSGRLKAEKKKNKWSISRENYYNYLQLLKREETIRTICNTVFSAVLLLFVAFLLINMLA